MNVGSVGIAVGRFGLTDQPRLDSMWLALAQCTVAMATQISELQQQLRVARDQCDIDGLTGLANQRRFREQLATEIVRAQRYGRPLALLIVDVDDFKNINDTYGHSIGNVVLARIANVLKPANHGLRQADFAARFGGEEFCVILPETELSGSLIKAERIRRSVEQMDWSDTPLASAEVTISTGVAAFPDHGLYATQIFDNADAALYAAKRGGKNRVAPASLSPCVRELPQACNPMA